MHSTSSCSSPTSHVTPAATLSSLRRPSTSSRRTSSGHRLSYSSQASTASSQVNTINSVMACQKSVVDMEKERRAFASELGILEPRPVVYWGSVEERMGSF